MKIAKLFRSLQPNRRPEDNAPAIYLTDSSTSDVSPNQRSTSTSNSNRNPYQNIYENHLKAMRHGMPIWLPEPNGNGSLEYMRRGVSIGDVIYFTRNGAPDFLFNICLDAQHPINKNNVPAGFIPISQDEKRRYDMKGSSITSKSIKGAKGGNRSFGLHFESSASEGAILTFPEGAHSEDVACELAFEDYMKANLDSWYRYANDVRKWGVRLDELHLVTGVHKAKAWGIAAFSNESTDNTTRLSFKSSKDTLSSGDPYIWEYENMTGFTNTGPCERHMEVIFEGVDKKDHQSFENQCLFVRTFNPGGRLPESNKVPIEVSIQDEGNDFSDSRSNVARQFNSISPSLEQSNIPNAPAFGQSRQNNLSIMRSGPDLADHPSNAINNFLLKERPDARIVITHDCHWIYLLTGDDISLPSEDELVTRFKNSTYEIVEEDGIITLRYPDSNFGVSQLNLPVRECVDTDAPAHTRIMTASVEPMDVDGCSAMAYEISSFDVVQQCLNLAPVPCLGPAFALFKSIWDVVQRISSYKYQLKELAKTIALLISKLNERYETQGPVDNSTWDSLSDFWGLLSDILDMVTKQKTYSFFKLLFVKDDMQVTINSYHQRITTTFRTFQISALLDIQALERQNIQARQLDHEQVLSKLREMEMNQNIMIRELQGQTKNPILTMAALQKRLKNRQGDKAELRFFERSFDYIRQTSGARFEYEDWMVTSLEVEFGRIISHGGFGIVQKGKWNECEVVLKVLKNTEGVTPNEKDLRNEIKTWSKLRHVNILQFLGASVLDDEPFIVTPLIKNGNVRDYLTKNPATNRVKIIHEISLGIVYLHSKHVIHGDIKGANVLIDDGERPLLCDFGLSRIKEDIDSRSSNEVTSSAQGSINWMAPERLEGGRLRTPCDIYSFGMTIYEIHTNSTPFGGVLASNFLQLVATEHRRPQKPQYDEAPQLTSEGWTLMTKCWAPEPVDRPKIETVCAELAHMKISMVVPDARVEMVSPRNYSGSTPPLPPSGYSSDRPPRRQTFKDPLPTNQRLLPGGMKTYHSYSMNIGHTHSLNSGHLPMSIMEEPFEMDVPFINPSNHPNNRKNTGNYGKHPSQGPGGPQQYVSPASVYIPQPSEHTQYSSPSHSPPSYSPPAPYDLPIQMHNAYSESQMLHNSPPFLPQDIASVYPPYSTHIHGQLHPQAPPLNSRSHTLPMPLNPYLYSDRSRSPDPTFPQPQYPQ